MAWRIKTAKEMPNEAYWAKPEMNYLYGQPLTDEEVGLIGEGGYRKCWKPEAASFKFGSKVESGKISQNRLQLD